MESTTANDANLLIGDLAARTGAKIPTIRYYETIGLMPEPLRSSSNQRRYARQHVTRLAFIRHARELGFPLGAIRELLGLAGEPDRPCEDADRIAREQLLAVRQRIGRLRALETELERMLADHRHGSIADCRVIEVLGDHAHCAHEHGSEDPTASI